MEEEVAEEGAGAIVLGTLPKGLVELKVGSLVCRLEEEEEGAVFFRDAAYASAVAVVASSTIASSILNLAVVGDRDTLCVNAFRASGVFTGDLGVVCDGGDVSNGCRTKGRGLLRIDGDADAIVGDVAADRNRGVDGGAVVDIVGGVKLAEIKDGQVDEKKVAVGVGAARKKEVVQFIGEGPEFSLLKPSFNSIE